MSKSHIIQLLNERALIQEKFKLLEFSMSFDGNTLAERTRLRNRLFKLSKELSRYTLDEIQNAIESKTKAQNFIKKHTHDEEELVLNDNSFIRFLMYLLILENAKPKNRFFYAIAINCFFGDKYEKKLKR
ncbi:MULTISPECIES: hypothetical protein [Burkholderia]|uniref:hypothetical protein n=1 Tax=Burkholderia TaxID=32008 RepID=UPI00163EC8FD|nr:hypothetical protein [Burkholderia gladioli]